MILISEQWSALHERAPVSEIQSTKLPAIPSPPVSLFVNSMKVHIVLQENESSDVEDDFSCDVRGARVSSTSHGKPGLLPNG